MPRNLHIEVQPLRPPAHFRPLKSLKQGVSFAATTRTKSEHASSKSTVFLTGALREGPFRVRLPSKTESPNRFVRCKGHCCFAAVVRTRDQKLQVSPQCLEKHPENLLKSLGATGDDTLWHGSSPLKQSSTARARVRPTLTSSPPWFSTCSPSCLGSQTNHRNNRSNKLLPAMR